MAYSMVNLKCLYLLIVLSAINSACSHLNSPPTDGSFKVLSEPQSRGGLPSALEAKDCGAPPKNETPNERFVRKGGRESKAAVRGDQAFLTVEGIEQNRELNRYERLNVSDREPRTAAELATLPILAKARSFLWQHWQDKRPAYLTITGSSVDATSTSHIFVEQDEMGRWRVAWRIVRHTGEIDELPTYYAVEWVRPAGWREPGVPLRAGEKPDPEKHELEFRDKCGEVEQSL
jgi:hypothetical protein